MKPRNKHRSLVLSSTFMGLVCGLVLTHQQAYAAQTAPVSNQESQITAVDAPKNNLTKTAAVNQDYSAENISTSAVSRHITPSTYSSLNNNAIVNQEAEVSDSTAAVAKPNTGATVSADNETNSSITENDHPTNIATSSPATNTGNSASTPTAIADNQATGNPTTMAASSEQPETNIIAQGTWGTSKWDYTQEGEDDILHLHAGTLGAPGRDNYVDRYIWDAGIGSLDRFFKDYLTKIVIDPGVIANQNSRGLFSHLYNLKTIQGLENLDTSQVTNMSEMFYYCESLTDLDVSHFDTSQANDMSEMFYMCKSLNSLDVSRLDTSQVTNMSEMFEDCKNLTSLDVSHFNTENVTNMNSIFENCGNLKNLDLSNFNTSQVTNMSWMFDSCGNLTSLDLSNFNTSQVVNMMNMFNGCRSLISLNLSHFNTESVTNMLRMFDGCDRLINLDLSNFNTSQVNDIVDMFNGCRSLISLNLSHFNTENVMNMFRMFKDCKNLNHLVLGPKTKLIDQNNYNSKLPVVPAAGTKIPGTDRVVTAPYWVATSGYQQGQRYTSEELQQLTGRDQVTTYDWDSQVPYQDTVESKSVTRTINVHYPDGQVKTIQDTVDLSHKVKVKADGSKTYGEWSTAQWEAYTVPELAGYQANQSKIPAQTVDSNTTDTTIDILYEPIAQTILIQYLDQGQVVGTQKLIGYTGETLIPNYHAPQGYEITSSPQPNITVDATGKQIIQVNVSHKITQSAETLTKTRTINIHLPNATVKTYRQVAVIKRNVAVDQVTGSKTYGPWHNNSWDAMDIPIIEGYTANQNSIAAQEVTAETENETIDIFYLQN